MKKVLVAVILSVTVLSLSLLAAGQATSSLDTQLLEAAKAGDAAAVQQLLQKGANINAKDEYGKTALIWAAQEGKSDVVKLLLERGANIEAKANQGATALWLAVLTDKREVVKLLLDKGANIEANGGYCGTALICAALQGNTEVVKLLLDKRANIEAKDSWDKTPLIVAAGEGKGKTEVVRLLLDKGANVEAKDKSDRTALIRAAEFGNTEVVKLLLDKRANIEARDKSGDTALTIVPSAKANVDVVKVLVEKGANIEVKNDEPYKMTALIKAAHNGKTDIVKLLLEKGANIEATGSNGRTALAMSASNGHTDVVKLLLEKGANVDAKNGIGTTALMWAEDIKNEKSNDNEKYRPGLPETIKVLQQATAQNQLAKRAAPLATPQVKPDDQNVREQRQATPATPLEILQANPYDENARENAIKFYASQQSLPPIPEEARQLFLQASALIKQTSTPEDLQKPIEMLFKTLTIAPWWGNAYYNLSRVLELRGNYDGAVKQLNYYLELKPSEADAAEARARIAIIQAEKEAAARKQQEKESVLAVKYVSGGATRLRESDAPAWWHNPLRMDALYTYMIPEEVPFYANVFRMPDGHLLTISLLAQSNNSAYTGDQIAINVWDQHDGGCSGGYHFAFGGQSYITFCGVRYNVSVSNQPNATVTVTYAPTGASVTIPVALLFRGRVFQSWRTLAGTIYQGSDKVEVLHFDASVINAAKDPNVNAMGLTPTSVIPYKK